MTPSAAAHYRFVDYATQGYLLFVAIVVAVGNGPGFPGWPWLLLGHLVAVVLVHRLILAGNRPEAPGWLRVLRDFYPILFYSGYYWETEAVNKLLDAPRLDSPLIRADHAVFNSQPSVELIANHPYPILSELLYAAYFSYYFMITALGIFFLWKNRDAFNHFVAVVTFVFIVCFAAYLFLPVVGPRLFYLDTPERELFLQLYGSAPPLLPDAVQGLPFQTIMDFIYRNFEAHSACFPSSHVAISMTTTWFSWRYLPRLRWLHLIVTTLLILSTVYLRYHYVIDVVAGILTALLFIPLGNRLYRRFDGVAAEK